MVFLNVLEQSELELHVWRSEVDANHQLSNGIAGHLGLISEVVGQSFLDGVAQILR